VNVPGLDQVRDRLVAAGVLARRGMVDPVRPDQAHTELSAGARTPRWVRPMTDVEPEDVAATVVAVVGSRRTKAVVSARLAVMLKAESGNRA
jgi:hypothetical protein